MTEDVTPTLSKAPEAFARLSVEQGRETEAYTLGVQAVLWGMQWVKAGEAFRLFTRPLAEGVERSPFDPPPHAVNVWGHARRLLIAPAAPRRDCRHHDVPHRLSLRRPAIGRCSHEREQRPHRHRVPQRGCRSYRRLAV
jgi:hypothetical protein